MPTATHVARIDHEASVGPGVYAFLAECSRTPFSHRKRSPFLCPATGATIFVGAGRRPVRVRARLCTQVRARKVGVLNLGVRSA